MNNRKTEFHVDLTFGSFGMKIKHDVYFRDKIIYLCADSEECLNNQHKDISGDDHRHYEEELKLCITHIHRYYGYQNIIVVNPSGNYLEKSTIEFLKTKPNLIYYQISSPESKVTSCGFDLKALGGKFIEQNFMYDSILHFDLDMFLLKDFPFGFTDKDTLGVYTKEASEGKINQGIINNKNIIMDTGLIVSKNIKIFTKWWDKIYEYKSQRLFDTQEQVDEWITEDNPFTRNMFCEIDPTKKDQVQKYMDNYEEYIMYEIYSTYQHQINLLKNYQFGEWYRYFTIPDEELDNVLFLHKHIKIVNGKKDLTKSIQDFLKYKRIQNRKAHEN